MNKWILIIVVVSCISCGKDEVVLDADAQISAWLDSVGVTANRDASGIYFYPITSNPAGQVVASEDVVAVYYQLFDIQNNLLASHQRVNGDSLLFKHNVSAVYPVGIDVVVATMRVGEVYMCLLPPSQAYADLSSGSLPANDPVRLEVEVVGISAEADLYADELTMINDYIVTNDLNNTITNPLDPVQQFPSGIAYKRLSAGTGTTPINGDTIVVNYVSTFLSSGGAVFSENGFEWIYGSNYPRPLAVGFEFAVSQMQTNESALFLIPSSQAYRESVLVIPQGIVSELIEDEVIPDYVASVPPYSPLIFNITRVD